MSDIATKRSVRKRVSLPQQSIPGSGPALMEWRQARGISRPLFAQMAHFSERKLATYEKAASLPRKVRRPIRETVNLIQALRELAGDEAELKAWLQRPNKAFGERSPLSLIIEGESSRIWQMVHQIRQGAFA